ncbi:ankyrin repeat-containing protein [Gossypium australe]|uniref:Ankyrin repeat-containing protein n=1 Tax=Gossypium australe TaxID=47621 RepID=A0A5B6WVI5_9ROSI|nr:ankyrin repeat-containing protein [Gossypium australe]
MQSDRNIDNDVLGYLQDLQNFPKEPIIYSCHTIQHLKIKFDKAGCGGMLRDEKGVACSLFSGSIKAMGSKMAEVMTIKTTLEISCVAFEWLLERIYRPWTLWNLFISIDRCINQLVRVYFALDHRQCNGMANALAKARVMRLSLLKAWW